MTEFNRAQSESSIEKKITCQSEMSLAEFSLDSRKMKLKANFFHPELASDQSIDLVEVIETIKSIFAKWSPDVLWNSSVLLGHLGLSWRPHQKDFIFWSYIDVLDELGKIQTEQAFARRFKSPVEVIINVRRVLEDIFLELARRCWILCESTEEVGCPRELYFKKESGGPLIHEAFGHGCLQGYPMEDSRGQARLNIVDDPTLPFLPGGFEVDDRGMVATKTVLVREGQVQRQIFPAAVRRQTMSHALQERPSNTIMLPGASSLSPSRHQIIVEKVVGGRLDRKNLKVELMISQAWKKTRSKMSVLQPFIVRIDLVNILNDISAVGDQVSWSTSLCKDLSGLLPVAHGSPDYILKNFEVAKEVT